jgi:cGAMP-activated phospholipase
MTANPENSLPFHILALSGGGFRSLYTAKVLERMENSIGYPLARHFDLLCGTSAGGLIALALALEIPASEIVALFEQRSKDIFASRSILRWIFGRWWIAKHSSNGLQRALVELFDNKLLGEARHPVLIPTVNYSTGKAQIFKTPHHPKLETDYVTPIVNIAIATSAAPVYFPVAQNSRGSFVDGGLVGNAPAYFGWHEARHFFNTDFEAIRVLAVGTMSAGRAMPGGQSLDQGFAQWRATLFDLILSAQESMTHYLLTHELGDRYLVVDEAPTPDQAKDIEMLDRVTPAAVATLISRGHHSAQQLLGSPEFRPFREHIAAPARFFHGPNSNS